MLEFMNPPTAPKPAGRYSQAVSVPANCRWLYISGQIGMTPDGTMLTGFEAQARQTWANLLAVLEAAGMGVQDLVKVTVFVTGPDVIAQHRAIRNAVLKDAQPASTYLVVGALAHPDMLVEIEAVAAKAE